VTLQSWRVFPQAVKAGASTVVPLKRDRFAEPQFIRSDALVTHRGGRANSSKSGGFREASGFVGWAAQVEAILGQNALHGAAEPGEGICAGTQSGFRRYGATDLSAGIDVEGDISEGREGAGVGALEVHRRLVARATAWRQPGDRGAFSLPRVAAPELSTGWLSRRQQRQR